METEYAMVKAADGSPLPRTDAQQSAEKFRRALAQRGGTMPPGMRWSETRGFHFPAERRRVAASVPASAPGAWSRREAEARQARVAREIFADEVRSEETLLESASRLAWCWARQFAAGGELSWNASADERAGWQLHRLGYHRPPLRIREQQLARIMR
jgi:hypothetical protein